MSSQVPTLRDLELDAWIKFLRAHAAITRQFTAELLAMHGLTINDFDVLSALARAPERALKRVDLADRVMLTPSGITRLIKGLESAGYVCNRSCDEDARVTYAVLTDEGNEMLEEARQTHLLSVRALFSERFEKDELQTFASLLERLPMSQIPCDG